MTAVSATAGRSIARDLGRWRRRSRLIRTLRILLPAGIAGILLYVASEVGWRSMQAASRPAAEAKTQIRMIAPRFYGQSSDGRSFMITARSALRDDKDMMIVRLDSPTLTLGFDEPQPSRVTAKSGVYREDTLKLQLNGDVRIDDGGGYRFASEQAMVDTMTGNITGETTMLGEGPTGQVKSNAYSVYDKGDRVVFRGGVRTRLERK
ncbi:LPS export ABC transporter periplasmic protein LptC [Caulobacter sp.]|uniref:LPS export ABC transporter periplasmic protein LptC n=1 Tax=Caulobacter sp. TaxID=78 RepID=UPI003BACACC8